jgi:DNA-3-methyladenine glycosylase
MGDMHRLGRSFFARDALEVAPDLLGKLVVHRVGDEILRLRITETEAYRGEEDTACHAHRGRAKRTETLYREPGAIYLYLCYGVHWMLNFVTGEEGSPQGVLIRAAEGAKGPGRLTKALHLKGELCGENAADCAHLWVEDDGFRCQVCTAPRVGIGYASELDRQRLWRFILKEEPQQADAPEMPASGKVDKADQKGSIGQKKQLQPARKDFEDEDSNRDF